MFQTNYSLVWIRIKSGQCTIISLYIMFILFFILFILVSTKICVLKIHFFFKKKCNTSLISGFAYSIYFIYLYFEHFFPIPQYFHVKWNNANGILFYFDDKNDWLTETKGTTAKNCPNRCEKFFCVNKIIILFIVLCYLSGTFINNQNNMSDFFWSNIFEAIIFISINIR